VSQYQKGKPNLDFTEARDSEWQWHPLGHMQICTSLQSDNHANNPPLSFLQAGCPSCRPPNSVKALKAITFSKLKTNLNQQWLFAQQSMMQDLSSAAAFEMKITTGWSISVQRSKAFHYLQ